MYYEKQYLEIKSWISEVEGKILFCSGAFGDLFVGIDAALKNNLPIIYWSKPATHEISLKFLEAFKMKYHVVNTGKEIWRDSNTYELSNEIKDLLTDRGFRTHGNNKCNLPFIGFNPNILCEEYNNFKDFKLNLPKNYVLICPCGSTVSNSSKRFFLNDEIEKITTILLNKNIEPVIVGNDNQLRSYDKHKKFKWLQFEKFENQKITVSHFIEAIRSCMFTISPDTSLKSLSAAMHVPTFVLKNRNSSNIFVKGNWDYIFLDKDKWKTLETFTFSELINKLNKFLPVKFI
jgi:hypothetical protein